jgi:hypothetical protein
MATVDSNFFEIQRRAYQWSMLSTLDDGNTSLLYDGNPNLAVSGNTPGETKLVSLLVGSFYVTSAGVLYFKNAMPNSWSVVQTGNVSSGPIFETYNFSTSLVWTVTHNKNTTNFIKTIFDENGEELYAKVNIIDSNSFEVTLTESIGGKVEVVFPPA